MSLSDYPRGRLEEALSTDGGKTEEQNDSDGSNRIKTELKQRILTVFRTPHRPLLEFELSTYPRTGWTKIEENRGPTEVRPELT